jgi:hypothetical protein
LRGIDTASWNIERPDFVAFNFQVRYRFVEAHTEEPRRILEKTPSGVDFFNKAQSFRPEPTVILIASSLPCTGYRLTGWSAANKVNWFKFGSFDFFDVAIPFHSRPMFLQYLATEGVYLYLPCYLHPGTFEAKIEATDT